MSLGSKNINKHKYRVNNPEKFLCQVGIVLPVLNVSAMSSWLELSLMEASKMTPRLAKWGSRFGLLLILGLGILFTFCEIRWGIVTRNLELLDQLPSLMAGDTHYKPDAVERRGWYFAAVHYYRIGQYQQAISQINRIPSGSQDNITLYYLAQSYLKLGQTEKVVETAKKIDNPRLYSQLAGLASGLGNYGLVVQLLAQRGAVQDINAVRTKTEALLALKRPDEANSFLGDIILDPETTEQDRYQLRLYQVEILLRQGRQADAAERISRLQQEFPEQAEVHFLFSEILWLQNYEQAVNEIKAGIQLAPTNYRGYYLMANLLSENQEYQAANAWYQKAVERIQGAGYPWPNARYCQNLLQQKDLAGAEQQYQAVIRESNSLAIWASVFDYLARAFFKSEQNSLALDAAQRANQLDPGLIQAWLTTALIYEQTGEFEKSQQIYRKVLKLDPENPTAWQKLTPKQ
jgi:tetratricopeptide (TPR) repeat protein